MNARLVGGPFDGRVLDVLPCSAIDLPVMDDVPPGPITDDTVALIWDGYEWVPPPIPCTTHRYANKGDGVYEWVCSFPLGEAS